MTDFDDTFEGLDAPRPLPNELRARLEAALVSRTGPLAGIDAPRALSSTARARIERAMRSGSARRVRPGRFIAVASAVAIVMAFLVAFVVVHTDPSSTNRTAGGSRLTPIAPIGDGTVGPLDISSAVPISLRFASSCDELLAYLKTNGEAHVTEYGLPGLRYLGPQLFGGRVSDLGRLPGMDRTMATPALTGGAAADAATSSTNNQEEGVEEPDTVQHDGSTLFVLRYNALEVLDVGTGQPVLLATVPVPPGAQSMFLSGDRLMLFSYGYEATSNLVTVLDVSTPSTPSVAGSFSVDGGIVSARMVDGVARVVVSSSPNRLPFVSPTDHTPEAATKAQAFNKDVIAASHIKDWIGDRPCESIARPSTFSGVDLTTVYTVDIEHANDSTSVSVLGGGETVYASPTSLYVATMDWPEWQPPLGALAPHNVTTQIHRFDIAGRDDATYVATGEVGGFILNQYSMSELDGDLRVATTNQPTQGEGPSTSAVTVLRQQDDLLLPIGAVGGLGSGEAIQGVRFVGDLGFVVTFLQKDPLYVIDLRTPTAPIVAGALDVTGFSSYLHPIDSGFLVGVGEEATDAGTVTGVQVSVFDVRDLAHPTLVGRVDVPNEYSPVGDDPHAFLYWAPSSLSVVPLSNQGQALVVRTDAQGAAEVGRVKHPGLAPITRSLVVGGTLFTVSDDGVMATGLADLVAGTWAPFPSR